MLLAFTLWFVVFVVLAIVAAVMSNRADEEKEKWRERTLNGVAFIIFLAGLFSALYIEYPAYNGKIVAVKDGNVVAEYPAGVFEPLAKGKLVRVLGGEHRVNYSSLRFYDKYPFVAELAGVELTLRVQDEERYAITRAAEDGFRYTVLLSLEQEVVALQVRYGRANRDNPSLGGYERFMKRGIASYLKPRGLIMTDFVVAHSNFEDMEEREKEMDKLEKSRRR